MMKPKTSLRQTVIERRTIQEFNGLPIPLETIHEILEAAIWAPFHSKKEPWRFILFMNDGRETFASAVLSTRNPEFIAKYGQQIRAAYCAQTPVHLVVVMTANLPSKAWEEAFAATSALIQNIQLLAWEQQIGVVWKTSPFNESPLFCEAIGVTSEEKIVGTLHMGYFNAEDQPMPKPRTPLSQLLHLIDH
ncbi:nitroreductase [Paenibacillus sp. 1781tsa1]|uniref:nitroreductase family protein n=1 Tax=Paenibacillus sp. 1781tsa1 TaxID=2953810 RepID=UPI00209EFA7F|nr:nitroreductase [Paenibacillus sp. 1781tsa1]MCP1181777.1 nitroreductase [Paenibacillus sp. 1781tsa1]